MKRLILFLIIAFLISCIRNNNSETGNKNKSSSDTVKQIPIEQLKADYSNIELKLYNEAKETKADNIDFSDITSGLEKEYNNCNSELLKPIIGCELAKNYYLNFRNSNDSIFIQKAENQFCMFLTYRNGSLASEYLKLEPDKTQYLLKKWDQFKTSEKDTILFYALLRGFEYELPDILKNQK